MCGCDNTDTQRRDGDDEGRGNEDKQSELFRVNAEPRPAAARLHCAQCNQQSLPLTPLAGHTSLAPRLHCSFSKKRPRNDATRKKERRGAGREAQF